MAAVATSFRPMCEAICSKLSFLDALALKRVADEVGRLGCCEVCDGLMISLGVGMGSYVEGCDGGHCAGCQVQFMSFAVEEKSLLLNRRGQLSLRGKERCHP